MTDRSSSSPSASRWVGRRLVKTRFQLKFSLAVFGLMTIFMALSWYLGTHYVDHLASSGLIAKSEVSNHAKVLVHVMVRSSLLSWLLAFGVSLFFSHFVAGPIFRFERIMREIQMGDISHRVKIRPYDELQDLAREMDGALVEIRRRVSDDKRRHDHVLASLEELAAQARRGGLEKEAEEALRLVSEERVRPPSFKLEKSNANGV